MAYFTRHPWRSWIGGVAALVAATMLAIGVVTPSVAAEDQVLLTSEQVTGIIDSYPVVVALADEFQAGDASPSDDPAAALGALMTYQNAIGRLNETVGAYGFVDYGEWIQVLSAIAIAYTYASQGGAMDAQMQAAIDAIQSNPSLTNEQKQVMLQQMTGAAAAMNASKPPQQNIDLVNENAEALEPIFNQS